MGLTPMPKAKEKSRPRFRRRLLPDNPAALQIQTAYDDIAKQLRTAYSVTFRSVVADNTTSSRLRIRLKKENAFARFANQVGPKSLSHPHYYNPSLTSRNAAVDGTEFGRAGKRELEKVASCLGRRRDHEFFGSEIWTLVFLIERRWRANTCMLFQEHELANTI